MSKFTNFLNLFKWNPIDNSEEEFDIDKALNENWDKIDTKLKDYITDTDNNINTLKTGKQDKLTAGNNITISNNTISAKDTTYSNATPSTNGLMSKSDKSKLDGLFNYNDTTIKNDINALKTSKQDKLTAGNNITISNNTISAKVATYSNATSSADGLMSKGDKSKLDNILNLVYPIGSIYMSVNSTSPAILFGGTWEQIKDRFLLACGDTNKNGETGGEATHTLTIDEIPPHFHNCRTYSGSNVDGKQWSIKSINNSAEGGIGTDNAGGGQPHNNMPPYLAVFIWKRTD